MLKSTGLYFTCQIGNLSDDTLETTNFSMTEGISELFTLSVTLVSTRGDINVHEYLLQPVSFTITVDGIDQRIINGVVSAFEQGDTGFQRTYYYLTVRPSLWVLSLNQDSRIFHKKSVPQLLDELIQPFCVQGRNLMMKESHPVHEYVTQKRESSWDFFNRLASQEGITYWFDQEGLCYSDSRLAMHNVATLAYNPHPASLLRDNIVSQWRAGAAMQPLETIHKDRNYHNPANPLRASRASADKTGSGTMFSAFESYGRFQEDGEGRSTVQYRMDRFEAGMRTGSGRTNCALLMPGTIFTLEDHPADAMNGEWQVITTQMQGKMPEAAEEEGSGGGTTLICDFTFIPGNAQWRPPYRYKPLADGDEVATVVGPEGEEIYVNEDGCVRVHFHWDRYNPADENASCWIRVAQGWNGSGFGMMAIPRIGQEVIVSYLNGDIDRPIITGFTYNGINRPPYELPGNKTKMVIRSKTHKGDGYNEISFEDNAGQEQLFLRAQKDLLGRVENDAQWHIVRDQHIKIERDQITELTRDRHESISGEWRSKVGGEVSQEMGSSLNQKVAKSLISEAGQEIHYKAGSKVVIEAGMELTLKAGGMFLTINPSGICMTGPVRINGGVAGNGSALRLLRPGIPLQIPQPPQLSPAQLETFQAEAPYCEECEKCKDGLCDFNET